MRWPGGPAPRPRSARSPLRRSSRRADDPRWRGVGSAGMRLEGQRPPAVATAGTGVMRAVPDAAVLSLEVWAELDTPEAALDEVARRTTLLQGVLDSAGV